MTGIPIIKHTSLTMFGSILGFILGLIAQIMIANYFGIGKEVDAFLVAATIPEFFYGITNSILMTSLIVILTESIVKYGKDKAWKIASNIFNISLIGISLLAILTFLLAPLIIKFLAPGFGIENFNLSVRLLRILSLTIIFYGVSSFTTGFLYTKKSFLVPSLFKSIISLSLIGSIFLFACTLNIFSLALGLVVGTGLGLFMQLLSMKTMINYHLLFRLDHQSIKELITLSFPLTFASFLFYTNRYITQIIASTQSEGTIAILNYAFLIISFPAILLSGSLATVVFPVYAEYAAKNDMFKFKRLFSQSIKLVALILMPATICFILLGKDLIQFLFERGMFSASASSATYLALIYYSVGLLAYGFNFILCAAFYAIRQMKIIALMNFLMLIINAVVSLLLVDRYSFIGLAFAMSLAYVATVSFAFFILKRNIGNFDEITIFLSLLKIATASFFMGISIMLVSLLGVPRILVFVLAIAVYSTLIGALMQKDLKTLFWLFKEGYILK